LQLWNELLLQHHTRSMEPHFDRCDGDAERLGGLVYAEVLDIAQQEDFAVDQGQIGDCLLEHLPDLLPFQCFGWNLAPIAEECGGDGSLSLSRFVERLQLYVLLAAKTAAGFVECDA